MSELTIDSTMFRIAEQTFTALEVRGYGCGATWRLKFQTKPIMTIVLEGEPPDRNALMDALQYQLLPCIMLPICEIAVAIAMRDREALAKEGPN